MAKPEAPLATDRKTKVAYVRALQKVAEGNKYGADLAAEIRKVTSIYSKITGQEEKPLINMQVSSEAILGNNALRVTCPTQSVISAEVAPSVAAAWIEFYLTRPRKDGTAETKLLGVSKYQDGDGRWSLTFTSERFARNPQDAVLFHAEVLSEEGRLLAASFLGAVV